MIKYLANALIGGDGQIEAMTRTKNRVYIAAPKTKPSRFLVELIKDFNIPHNDEINMQVVDLFNLRCPVCGFPLKYEFNKNYGLKLCLICAYPEIQAVVFIKLIL